tara:strand:- start:153 stop:578 length:426 start_codon:yes stop_codon:yes gene_type:complete
MSDIFIVEKFNANKIYSILYKDGKTKQYFIKRLKIETLLTDKKFNLISEARGSKCKLISNYDNLMVSYNYKLKNNEKVSKDINVNNFIDVKGYKSIGKRLDNKLHMSGFKFKEIITRNDSDVEVPDNDQVKDNDNNELTLF